MRVFFLAATTLCLMGMAASAQPSKMRPEGSGLVEYVALTPASGSISDFGFEVSKIESTSKSANARSTAISPKASRIAGLAAANTRLTKMKRERSNVEPIRSTNAALTDLDPESSGAARLTGALRDVGSPWLEHAIKDVGTNPTGWKRLWCAKSLNMSLERMASAAAAATPPSPASTPAATVRPASRRHRRDEASRRHREGGAWWSRHSGERQQLRPLPAPAKSASANMRAGA